MGQIEIARPQWQSWQAAIVARKSPKRFHQLRLIGKESDLFVESPVEAGDHKMRALLVFLTKRIQCVTPSAPTTCVGNQFLGLGNCVDLGSSQKNEAKDRRNSNRARCKPLTGCIQHKCKCRNDDYLR